MDSGGICHICGIDETLVDDRLIFVDNDRSKLIECSELREDGKDNVFEHAKNLTIHKSGRNDYTKPQNIKKTLKRVATEEARTPPKAKLRSRGTLTLEGICLFCSKIIPHNFVELEKKNIERRKTISKVNSPDFKKDVLKKVAERNDVLGKEV